VVRRVQYGLPTAKKLGPTRAWFARMTCWLCMGILDLRQGEMIVAATERLDLSVLLSTWQRLRAAAALSHQSLQDFMVSAAEARADEVLSAHTVVPAAHFDALVSELDAPDEANDSLRAVSERPRRVERV
jgi:uncharacterized protein (DUF1778 family)